MIHRLIIIRLIGLGILVVETGKPLTAFGIGSRIHLIAQLQGCFAFGVSFSDKREGT